jgi:hypothetical protein
MLSEVNQEPEKDLPDEDDASLVHFKAGLKASHARPRRFDKDRMMLYSIALVIGTMALLGMSLMNHDYTSKKAKAKGKPGVPVGARSQPKPSIREEPTLLVLGLQIDMKLVGNHTTMPHGRNVRVDVTLANGGNRRIRIIDVRQALAPALIQFTVTRGGRPLRPRKRARSKMQFDPERDAVIDLLPGGKFTRRYDVSALFAMDTPGAYEIVAAYVPASFREGQPKLRAVKNLNVLARRTRPVSFQIAPRDAAVPNVSAQEEPAS